MWVSGSTPSSFQRTSAGEPLLVGGIGGAIDPEAPHEARIVLPSAPIVAAVVAPVEGIVRVQHDAAGAQRGRFKGLHERPL